MKSTALASNKNFGNGTKRPALGTKRRAAKIIAAGSLALAAGMTTGVGTANAESVQTEASYPSRSACQAAGPGVMASTPGNWDNFWCVPDPAVTGSWRLVISSGN